MKRYKYNDWLNGVVVLGYDYFIPENMKQPVIVTWNDFDEEARALIKKEQKRLFKNSVNQQIERFKSTFLKRYKKSLDKETLVERELEQCSIILRSEIPNYELISTLHWDAIFQNISLKEIQQYYSDYIVKGIEFNYESIHPEKSIFQKTESIPSNIYCQALWDYYEWIRINSVNNFKEIIDNEIPMNLEPEHSDTDKENDFILSTIEDWLINFKEKMNEVDYETLISVLKNYLTTNTFLDISKPIKVNGKVNMKAFGWALNRILDSQSKGIEKEFLIFAKKNISLFSKVKFDETNYSKSNLYKYFTTKTQ